MSKYKRTDTELEKYAVKYWPTDLARQAASLSAIPLLIRTQDKFISLLSISESGPEAWKDGLALQKEGELYPNLFLKHLQVLADFGGEPLQRLNFAEIFPEGKMDYKWREKDYIYYFKAVTDGKKTKNEDLFTAGKNLSTPSTLTGRMEDIIMLLLYGGGSNAASLPDHILEKWTIGGLIGQTEQLSKFVKERYIYVSRITGGANANTLGQIAQAFVKQRLLELLPDWKFTNRIPGISENAGATNTSFDIVVKSPSGKYVAIEVSFQETTNSVYERKKGQAENRANIIHAHNHKIAYVIDGAGNFARRSALKALCQFSDCTVAFSASELDVLVSFLRDYEEGLV
jgi:hypothetical protein